MIACGCHVCKSSDPRDNRLRSSILVSSAATTLVIDTTPDFRTQMLREHVTNLDAVVFTHMHKDHIAGLDDIKAYNFFQQKPMDIYANELTYQALKKEFSYIFAEKTYPGVPKVTVHEIDKKDFKVGDLTLKPIEVFHLHLPVLGFRIQNFTYITDANRIEESEKEKIKGSEIIVVNALRKQEHVSHFNLREAIELIQELEIPKGYLTHVSHQMGSHEEITNELPANIQIAYDGLQLHFKGNKG